jgi:hypothetical protein
MCDDDIIIDSNPNHTVAHLLAMMKGRIDASHADD